MTVSDWITKELRPLIGDTVTAYRWDDEDHIIPVMNAGIRDIYGKHPESICGSAVLTDAPAALTAVANTIPLADSWLNALLHFTAARILMEDQENGAAPAMVAQHWALYMKEVGE